MKLPATIQTEGGLSVEGASSVLLADLLAEYQRILQSASPEVWRAARPGLSEGQIEQTLKSIGIETHPELLIWWSWRNGWSEDVRRGALLPQMTLENACEILPEVNDLPVPTLRPAGIWLPVSGWDLSNLVAFSAESTALPSRIRKIAPEFEPPGADEKIRTQVVSLCTYVTWHLDGIETGRIYFDRTAGAWKADVEAWRALPLELRRTGLI